MARITVINDQADFLDVMREILEGAGHRVVTMAGAQHSIDEVAETHPDLMVIDLRLEPDRISGWDVIVLARDHGKLADVPIILTTADSQGALAHADELQALTDVHLLLKPFELGAAEELVRQLLDRGATRSQLRDDAPAGYEGPAEPV